MEKANKARPVWNGGDKFHVTMTVGGHEIVVKHKAKDMCLSKVATHRNSMLSCMFLHIFLETKSTRLYA